MNKSEKNKATAPDGKGAGHHPYGPSRWSALLDCSQYEGRASSADEERGTALHKLFARVLVGEEVEDPGDLFEANVVKLATKYRSMHLEDKGDLAKGERVLLVEVLVWLDVPMGQVSDIYGRPDCAFMDRNHILHVIDLKSAENPERDYLPQLIAYASGIVTSTDFDPVAVCFHVAYADSGREVTVQMPADEVWSRYEEFYERIQDIASGNRTPPRQCGWCSICEHFESCPAPRAVAETVSATLANAPERWSEFNSARKAQLCVLAEAVCRWGSAIKERAAADAKAGEAIEDPANGIYYAVQERQGRLLQETDAAWRAVRNLLSPEAYKACLDVSASRLTAALKDAGMAAKDIRALLEECGTRGPSTLVFVRKATQAGAA